MGAAARAQWRTERDVGWRWVPQQLADAQLLFVGWSSLKKAPRIILYNWKKSVSWQNNCCGLPLRSTNTMISLLKPLVSLFIRDISRPEPRKPAVHRERLFLVTKPGVSESVFILIKSCEFEHFSWVSNLGCLLDLRFYKWRVAALWPLT